MENGEITQVFPYQFFPEASVLGYLRQIRVYDVYIRRITSAVSIYMASIARHGGNIPRHRKIRYRLSPAIFLPAWKNFFAGFFFFWGFLFHYIYFKFKLF